MCASRPCVSTFLSLCSYLCPNPCLHDPPHPPCFPLTPSPACLFLALFVSFLRPLVSDLPPVTLSHRRAQASVLPDTKPDRWSKGEKKGGGGLGPSRRRRGKHTGASEIDKHQLARATPTHLILLRFSHQCPLPLPHNVKKRIGSQEKIVGSY